MNKKLLFTLLFATVVLSVFGQQFEKKRKPTWELDSVWRSKTHYEAGINVSEFVKTFLVPNNNNNLGANATTYLLSFKTIFKGGPAIRFGLGGNYTNKKVDDDDFSGIQTQVNSQFNTRLGFEWQFNLGRRWNFYAGVDGIFSTGKTRVETPNFPPDKTIVETKTTAFGGGPVAGVQFRISKRISLLTETAVYAKSTTTDDKMIDTSFPANNSQTKTKEFSFNIIAPQSIYLIVTF